MLWWVGGGTGIHVLHTIIRLPQYLWLHNNYANDALIGGWVGGSIG